MVQLKHSPNIMGKKSPILSGTQLARFQHYLHTASWLCPLRITVHVHPKCFYSENVKKKKSCAVPGRMPSTSILQRGNLMCQILWVWAHPYGQRKTYMLCIMGVGSLVRVQEAGSFSYMPYIVGMATPTLFGNSFEKSMGVGRPMTYGKACSLCKKNMGNWTPMKYFIWVSMQCMVKIDDSGE